MRARPPRLTPEIVADDDAVTEALDDLLLRDPEYRRLTRRIVRRQRELRGLVSEQAWSAYILLEDVTNERLDHAIRLVTRWAFRAGQRNAGRRP